MNLNGMANTLFVKDLTNSIDMVYQIEIGDLMKQRNVDRIREKQVIQFIFYLIQNG